MYRKSSIHHESIAVIGIEELLVSESMGLYWFYSSIVVSGLRVEKIAVKQS